MATKRQIICNMKKLLILLALVAVSTSTLSAKRVRVMSYNVHNCVGDDGIKSYQRCADIIRDAQPDVVAIQEVDSMTTRNECYVLGEMAKRAGYHAYYGKTIPYRGGGYGIGVLTKEEALSVKFHPLPCRKEPRGLLLVEMKHYYLIATHLSLVKEDQHTSVKIIRDIVEKLDKPVFIAGDMNAKPASQTMKAFKKYSKVLNDENKFTFSAKKPRGCIDYILGANGAFKRVSDYVLYESLASDHLPLWVDVKFRRAKKCDK